MSPGAGEVNITFNVVGVFVLKVEVRS